MQNNKLDILTNPLVEEILGRKELQKMIENNEKLNHYIGFEISGKLHIGSCIFTMSIIRDLLKADVNITIFLADWHSWINNKLGGDIKVIQKVALELFKELFIGSAKCLNIDTSKLNFVLGTDLYNKNPQQWVNLMEVSKNSTLSRIKRAIDIMGRKQGEIVQFASLIYPPLQVADIFTLKAHIAHAGMDQRKAHVIARKVAKSLRINPLLNSENKKIKPIAIHHKLLPGLSQPPKWPITQDELKQMIGDLKMSKSKPDGAIFVMDSPEEIKRKVDKAFCPQKDISYNPVIIWACDLIWGLGYNSLTIKRPEKWGGNLEIKSTQELKDLFVNDQLHPQDLKQAVANHIIELLSPARKHFENPKIQEAIKYLESLQITR